MAPPKGKGKRSKKETPQHYTDEEDEPGEKQALNDRIVQFFEDRPCFYDICLLSRKIPVPVGNGIDFSSCAPLKTHSDHAILLLMVFPFSGTYF